VIYVSVAAPGVFCYGRSSKVAIVEFDWQALNRTHLQATFVLPTVG
jgi:hypothetical protein